MVLGLRELPKLFSILDAALLIVFHARVLTSSMRTAVSLVVEMVIVFTTGAARANLPWACLNGVLDGLYFCSYPDHDPNNASPGIKDSRAVCARMCPRYVLAI